jgi:hypothetical protein
MLWGSFQRAAMAILLIGTMFAPLSTCLQQSSKGAHSCCMQPESSQTLRTDCCVVRSQLPATLVAPRLAGPSPSAVVHEYVGRVEAQASDEHAAVVVIPPLSPPTGAFILRI